MSETNPILKSFRESPGIRLAVLFGSFFILLLISSIISIGVNNLRYGGERSHILISSIVQSLLAFCLPAIILAKFCSNHWKNWLELTRAPQLRAILGVILVYLISMPAMEWLIEWNSNLHFPSELSGLEEKFRAWETAGEETTKIILSASGFLPVLGGVLVIGVLTGFSEELFFRGGLQKILGGGLKNNGVAVWLAAIIFSTMHFQFFGFFPRLLMGVFFGYLLIWSRSIWVPVFAHVLNNSMVVIASAVYGEAGQNMLEMTGSSNYMGNSWAIVGSIIFTGLFLGLCKGMFKINQTTERWQKNHLPPVSER